MPGDVDSESMFWPSRRLAPAAKWWLIAELARRNRELEVAPVSPETDVDVTLDVRGIGLAGNVFLSADGSIHLFPGEDGFERLEPFALFHAPDPRGVADEIAAIMGWHGDVNSTAVRPLTYLLLAEVANAVTFGTHDWDIVAIDEWHPEHFRASFDSFVGLPDVYDAARAGTRPGIWAITRDGEPIAVISETATLHRPVLPPVDLIVTFDHVDGSRRRLAATVLELLDDEER